MKKVTQILGTAVFASAMMLAQGGPPRNGGPGGQPPDPATMVQMRVNMLASRLNLTDAQKTQATSIFTQSVTNGQTIRTNLQTVQQSISDAVKKNDTASIDQLSVNLGTLQGQLTAIDRKADAAFYAILTPDQQNLYNQRPAGGPGGFGGPGRGRF